MKEIQERCLNTTRHISDKILLLRRAKRMTQEEFAEFIGVDRRTVARAEDGRHRPSAETMEMIAKAYCIPISYFYDNSSFKSDISKSALLYEITSKLNILPKSSLRLIKNFMDIIND